MDDVKNDPFGRLGPGAMMLHLVQVAAKIAAESGGASAQQKFAAMIAGIQKYMSVNIAPVTRDRDVVGTFGASRILYIRPHKKTKKAHTIMLIPSLINGWEILDLLPGQSFADYLAAQGHDVYIVDWGDVRADPQTEDMAGLLHTRLADIVQFMAQKSSQKITMMGYCMGGLLMAGAYPVVAPHIRAHVYLASPWDFHANDPHLTALVQKWLPQMLPMLHTSSFLPNAQIQSLFALVDPDMILTKFSRFLDMDENTAQARTFMAAEDWLSQGRDLPAAIARACLQDFYIQNKTAAGNWSVGDHKITPELLRGVPSLVVAPRRDQIVETQTAAALYHALGAGVAAYLEPDIGHIGMMASPRAVDVVWAPVATWLDGVN